MPQQDYW